MVFFKFNMFLLILSVDVGVFIFNVFGIELIWSVFMLSMWVILFINWGKLMGLLVNFFIFVCCVVCLFCINMLVVSVIMGVGGKLFFFLNFWCCLVVFRLFNLGICKFISIMLNDLVCILFNVICLFVVVFILWLVCFSSNESNLRFCCILLIISMVNEVLICVVLEESLLDM